MLPQNHFLVAAVVTVVAVVLLYPDLERTTAIAWVVVSGLVAAAIDLDVIIITRWEARTDPELVPWSDPRFATRDLKPFLVLLFRKGILERVKYTHLASGVLATLLAYLLVPPFLVPVALGAWSHLASDVPYLSTISRLARKGV